MGYSYARIYDHYIDYYDQINFKLKSILGLWSNKEKALKFLIDSLQEGKDFVIEKAPETVQQLIEYTYFCDIMTLCIAVIVLILSLITFAITSYLGAKTGDNFCFVVAWVTFFTTVISTIVVFRVSYSLMKIVYAPNVLVLEWLGVV